MFAKVNIFGLSDRPFVLSFVANWRKIKILKALPICVLNAQLE